ncbi:hypothetical protein [Piscinibacter sp. XHJ-5]|uniref:hypothetical protein n=1 Tax=Piscinibacter sp. XHJ-5 TaxID=3037797 RepID=UPI0024531610|nr:hypothetical protein [Piscinibacter sp. XHJ-5]
MLKRLLPVFTPLVAAWAAWQRRRVLRNGMPLTPSQQQVAAAVGVAHPERIRVRLVERVPIPGGRIVEQVAHRLDLPSPDVDGLALGYALYLRGAALSMPLLAHECRHVRQCEQAGSLNSFLFAYLKQVARHGYEDAPFEADARDAARRWSRRP